MINFTRRHSREMLAAVGLAIALACHGSMPRQSWADSPQPGGVSKPNIILVMTDDQGYGPVGRHGHPWIQTPNLDSLYDQSLRFTTFLVSPTCSPTRSAIMTGRHPMRNGITHTILERERMTLDATILPQLLGKSGYRTAIFGKWHLGDEDDYQPHNRGFEHAFIHGAGGIGQAYNCSCADVPGNKYFDPVVRINGKFHRTQGFCTDVFFTAALDWIDSARQQDQPFFAYIATNAPHGPFISPDENKKRFEQLGFAKNPAGFYGMIENIDFNMGRLLERLDAWQLDENTVLIFMSDNGMAGGGGGQIQKQLGKDDQRTYVSYNAGMKGLKGSADEGGVRVPFFVRWPEKIAPGDASQLAAHIDILPTLCELAGAELPKNQVEGRSLLPILKNADHAWENRTLFTHIGRWPTGADPNEFQWKRYAVRDERFRLVGDQLYDMQSDPGQTTDVAARHPEAVKRLKNEFDSWWQDTVPMMVNESAPMSPTRPFHVAFRAQQESEGIPMWQPKSVQK